MCVYIYMYNRYVYNMCVYRSYHISNYNIVYIYIYTYVCMCIHIYIYIYICITSNSARLAVVDAAQAVRVLAHPLLQLVSIH